MERISLQQKLEELDELYNQEAQKSFQERLEYVGEVVIEEISPKPEPHSLEDIIDPHPGVHNQLGIKYLNQINNSSFTAKVLGINRFRRWRAKKNFEESYLDTSDWKIHPEGVEAFLNYAKLASEKELEPLIGELDMFMHAKRRDELSNFYAAVEIIKDRFDSMKESSKNKKRIVKTMKIFGGLSFAGVLLYAAIVGTSGLKDYYHQRKLNNYQHKFEQTQELISSKKFMDADKISENLQSKLNKETHEIFKGLRNKAARYDNEVIDPRIRKLKYISIFEAIKNNVEQKKYDDVSNNIKKLADVIEKNDFPNDDSLLAQVTDYTYPRLIFVPQKSEERTIKAHYKQGEWVEEKEVGKFHFNPLVGIVNSVKTVVKTATKGGKNSSSLMGYTTKDKVKGHYKKVWVPEKTETINTPEHNKKVLINPYSGKETVIDDFIPLINTK